MNTWANSGMNNVSAAMSVTSQSATRALYRETRMSYVFHATNSSMHNDVSSAVVYVFVVLSLSAALFLLRPNINVYVFPLHAVSSSSGKREG